MLEYLLILVSFLDNIFIRWSDMYIGMPCPKEMPLGASDM
jgi:hypothetical protein